MTQYEKFRAIEEIIVERKIWMDAAEAGECPVGMTEEQWGRAELADILEGHADNAISDIREILRTGRDR